MSVEKKENSREIEGRPSEEGNSGAGLYFGILWIYRNLETTQEEEGRNAEGIILPCRRYFSTVWKTADNKQFKQSNVKGKHVKGKHRGIGVKLNHSSSTCG